MNHEKRETDDLEDAFLGCLVGGPPRPEEQEKAMTLAEQVNKLTELVIILFWTSTLFQLALFVMIIITLRRRRNGS